MKIRSIHKLNNRVRNYLYLFLTIFIFSSVISFALFFWSITNEVGDKSKTWSSYFTQRISFLENVVTSRATFDHGIASILKVTHDGEIVNSRPFPTEIKSIEDFPIYPLVRDFASGEVRLIKEPGTQNCIQKKNFLVIGLDNSITIAEIPAKMLLPVNPRNTELFINDSKGDCVFHTEDKQHIRRHKLGGLVFSNMHVFATSVTFTPEYGGFSVTIGKDISTEFYAGLLLLTLSLTCLAVLMKRSTFLTWDLDKSEQDFIRIGKLLGHVSALPDKNLSHIPAIEHTAQKIRTVDWEKEAAAMSFVENKGYINSTAFFARNILELLDQISEHSKELNRSRQEYHDLVQQARSIILRTDINGTCTFFNEYAQSFFGFSQDEMVGNAIVGTIIPKTDQGESDLEELMETLTRSPENIPFSTNRNIRKDGSSVWIFWSNTPIYNDTGVLVEVLSVGTDVTEQKHAEQELEQTRNFLRNIIDSMPSIIIGLNNNGEVTHYNSAAQHVSAIPAESIEGAAIAEAFPSIARYSERIYKAIKTGTSETGFRTQDMFNPGTFQDIMIYPLNSGMKGAVIRIDDSTERVRIEEMMIQTEKMMSIGGLAAGMAHEINNPLGGILQGIQNVIRRLSPDLPANLKAADRVGCSLDSVLAYLEDRKIIKTLNGITDSGVRAADIVSGMLEFSRKSDSRKAPGDLRKMMDKASTLAAQDYNSAKKFDFKQIKVTKEYDENLTLVKCTETEVEQVFLNLLRNSAQAMFEWDEMNAAPEINIRMYNMGNMVRCTISDNGPGMDECTRKRVFEPFYTTKAPGSGTGLGLSVSYFIITQNHLGEFDVKSVPGKGTTFSILLPALIENY